MAGSWDTWCPAASERVRSFTIITTTAEEMICCPVSLRVGNVKNNDPGLTAPIAAVG